MRINNNPTYNPDILDCLANLSSDEVFTPPMVAEDMLNQLPKHLWLNPNTKFLDPCSKSGVFLREIAKRLMKGLKDEIPDEKKRRKHIFTNMLHGLAITELTALISRRTLYYSKDASSSISVSDFKDSSGNIYFMRGEHVYDKGKCKYCRLSKNAFERGDSFENYAYTFIHNQSVEEIFNVKFDVIIGNPPYQFQDAGDSTGAYPIYQIFVEQAKQLKPKYLSMIIPSRWFAGGKGLDQFRKDMLSDRRISHLVDYSDAADCFPGVEIKGGVCYFLWNSNYDGDCEVSSILPGGKKLEPEKRAIDKFDVLVRYNQQVKVLEKVLEKKEESLETMISKQKPFDFRTNFTDFEDRPFNGSIKIYARQAVGYISRSKVKKNQSWIDKYKVLLSRSYNGGYNFPHQIINKPVIAKRGSVCTETYIILGLFDKQQHAENLASFVRTKFFRFMVSMRKVSQDNPVDRFKFVPKIDFTVPWNDSTLYKRYNISIEEQSFVDTIVKEMPNA